MNKMQNKYNKLIAYFDWYVDAASEKNIPFDSLATTQNQSLAKVDITYSDYSTPAKTIYTSFTYYYMIDDSIIDTDYFK